MLIFLAGGIEVLFVVADVNAELAGLNFKPKNCRSEEIRGGAFSIRLNTPEIPPEIKFHLTKIFPTIGPLNTPDLWNSTRSGSNKDGRVFYIGVIVLPLSTRLLKV